MKEWIVGRNPVYEVLRAGRREVYQLWLADGVQEKGRLADILQLAARRQLRIKRGARSQLDAYGSGNQGVALEASPFAYHAVPDLLARAEQQNEPPFILLLDALQDPQNLGTLLRTAEVVGVHGLVLPYRRTATVTPAVVSASSGASEHMLIAQANLAQTIAQLKQAGLWVIGLEGSPQASPPERVRLDGPLALVVGSEAQGMRSLVRSHCDLLLRLPMRGRIDSLNAAVAGSIALYLAWQARGFSGASIDV
ncbi:MAG: 23S rRNA (guanosine(2251)-2'-O)-methyltransferase RlmB [Anaerolineales bacterium]|nr:23S rRNA (guanosine(2251)-2'-O)-methyltransferase RlmB [Anaerolineales bacterium]